MEEPATLPISMKLQDYRPAVLGKDIIDLRLTWAQNATTSGWQLDVTTADGSATIRATSTISHLWNRAWLKEDERRQLVLKLLAHLSARNPREPYMIYRPDVLVRAVADIALPRAA